MIDHMIFPGWPGPINPRGPGVGGVAYPASPSGAFSGGPLAGLQAYGVPLGYGPGGQPMLLAGMGQGMQMPPTVPGMPQMPGPPEGFFSGALAGGLLNQVFPLQQQRLG